MTRVLIHDLGGEVAVKGQRSNLSGVCGAHGDKNALGDAAKELADEEDGYAGGEEGQEDEGALGH